MIDMPSHWWEPSWEDADELDEMDPILAFPMDYDPDEELPFN